MLSVRATTDAPVTFDATVNGVAAYLDQFALNRFANDTDLGDRFIKALLDCNGSLLVSGTNFVELAARTGTPAQQLGTFLNKFGARWVPLELNPYKVMELEKTGAPNPCLAADMVKAFFEARKAEYAGSIMPISAEAIFRLGTFMDWIVGREDEMIQKAARLDQVCFDAVKNGRQEYKKDPSRLPPPMAWNNSLRATFVMTNLVRAIVKRGEPLKKGDARDLFHASLGAAYGSFAALDRVWAKRVNELPKPNGIAKIYYGPELEQLVDDLEDNAARCRNN